MGDLGSMIFSDPPSHDIARKIVNRSFTPRKVEALEDRLRPSADRFARRPRGAITSSTSSASSLAGSHR